MFGKFCTSITTQPTSDSPWLALALDMDECVMNPSYVETRRQLLEQKGALSLDEEEQILISCNAPALEMIARKAAHHYERLYLLFGSKRQDFAIDHLNNRLKGTLSGFIALQLITRHLKSLLPNMPVELLSFAMADLSVGPAASTDNIGVTCDLALEHLQGNPHSRHPQWGGIESGKRTLTYAHAHLLAVLRKKEGRTNQIVYALIDDGLGIRQQCTEFVTLCPQNLPAKIQFNFIDYSGVNTGELETKLSPQPSHLVGTLNGLGDLDLNFMGTLRSIEQSVSTPEVWPQESFHYRDLRFDNPLDLHLLINSVKQGISNNSFNS